MYTLQRENVVKITDSEVKRDIYLAQGYKLVEKAENAADKADNAPKKKA